MAKTKISIALVEKYHIMRVAISRAIDTLPGYQVIMELCDGVELLDDTHKNMEIPAICIMDIVQPSFNGFDMVKRIRTKWPDMKILIFTDLEYSVSMCNKLQNYIDGYLSKRSNLREIEAMLDGIAEGRKLLPEIKS